MFTVPKDTQLSVELIENAIKYNEEERVGLKKKDDYYIGKHDILTRSKPTLAKNAKVVTNHAKYITDIHTGYLMGNSIEYSADEEIDLEPIIEEYKEQNIQDFDTELAKEISKFGREYELVYADGNNPRSVEIDPRNAICVYDNTVQHKKLFGIIYNKKDNQSTKSISKGFKNITVYSAKKYWTNCVDSKDEITIGDENTHSFGKVPLIHYRNNGEEMGDFEAVISLIDAYNLLQSDRINDKQQLVEAILIGYGITLEDDQREELKKTRTLFGVPLDAKIDYIAKTLDEGQVDILRKNIENDIHKISMTPNMTDENFVGNASGVALRFKLLPFEQHAKTKENYMRKGLLERFELYNNYLIAISKSTEIDVHEVKVTFRRNLPQNILEIAQIVNLLDGIVDRETLVSQVPFVDDAGAIVEKAQEEALQRFQERGNNFGTGELNDNPQEEEEE